MKRGKSFAIILKNDVLHNKFDLKMEQEKIERIIECLENFQKRPQMFAGGNGDIDAIRSFLNGFHFAFFAAFDYRITMWDEFQKAHEKLDLKFNTLGFEGQLLAQGISKEEIIQKIIQVEIETWKLIRDEK